MRRISAASPMVQHTKGVDWWTSSGWHHPTLLIGCQPGTVPSVRRVASGPVDGLHGESPHPHGPIYEFLSGGVRGTAGVPRSDKPGYDQGHWGTSRVQLTLSWPVELLRPDVLAEDIGQGRFTGVNGLRGETPQPRPAVPITKRYHISTAARRCDSKLTSGQLRLAWRSATAWLSGLITTSEHLLQGGAWKLCLDRSLVGVARHHNLTARSNCLRMRPPARQERELRREILRQKFPPGRAT